MDTIREAESFTKTIILPPIVHKKRTTKSSKTRQGLQPYSFFGLLPNPESEKEKEKEKKQRIVTQTKRWNNIVNKSDFEKEAQLVLLREIQQESNQSKKAQLLSTEIRKKISGYKSQDVIKEKYVPEYFVTLAYIVQILIQSHLNCYYCKEDMYVWYETSRDPKQWTVERIQNEIGHNCGNVEICCLSCNIRRRCMYHEKFRFTKQMVIQKTDK